MCRKQLSLWFFKNKPQLHASQCLLLIITNSFWMRCIIRAKPCTIHEHLECRMRSSHTAWEGWKCQGSLYNEEAWLCTPGAEQQTLLPAHCLYVQPPENSALGNKTPFGRPAARFTFLKGYLVEAEQDTVAFNTCCPVNSSHLVTVPEAPLLFPPKKGQGITSTNIRNQ